MIERANKRIATKLFRFDARLKEEQKLLIQRAAEIEGRSMTDFVLHSAEQAAERTINERAMLVLNARESEAFVDAIASLAGDVIAVGINWPPSGPWLPPEFRASRSDRSVVYFASRFRLKVAATQKLIWNIFIVRRNMDLP